MHSTDERMKLIESRIEKVKKEQLKKRIKNTALICCMASFTIICAVSGFIADNSRSINLGGKVPTNAASIFADGYALGYVVIGILAFSLGVSVTVLCSMLHKKSEEENDNDRNNR